MFLIIFETKRSRVHCKSYQAAWRRMILTVLPRWARIREYAARGR